MNIKEIKKRFEELMGTPEFLKCMDGQFCFVCGQPYDKSPQVKEVWGLLEQAYEAGKKDREEEIYEDYCVTSIK